MAAETENFFKHELGLTPTSTAQSKTVEVFHAMSELIILTASRALQGKEVRNALSSKFAKLFWDLDAGFIPINFMFTKPEKSVTLVIIIILTSYETRAYSAVSGRQLSICSHLVSVRFSQRSRVSPSCLTFWSS